MTNKNRPLPPKNINNINNLHPHPTRRRVRLGLLLLVVTLGWASSAAAQPTCSINPIISPLDYNPAFNAGGTSHANLFDIYGSSGDGNRLLLRGPGFPDPIDLTGENPDGSPELYLYDIPTETYTQITHSFGARFSDSSYGKIVLSENGDHVFFVSDGNLTGENPEGDGQVFFYDYPTDTLRQISSSWTADSSATRDPAYFGLSSNGNFVFNVGFHGGPRSGSRLTYLYNVPTDTLTLIDIAEEVEEVSRQSSVGGISGDGAEIFFLEGGKMWSYQVSTDSFRELFDFSGYSDWKNSLFHDGEITLLITAAEVFTPDSMGTLTQVTEDGVFPTIVRPPGVPLTNIPRKDSPIFHSRQMDIDGQKLFARPDSPRYFFLSNYPGRADREIFLFDAETSTLTQLTDSHQPPLAGKKLEFKYVSPDGNTLIFTGRWDSNSDGKHDRTDIFRYDVSTATLTTLFSRGSAPIGNRRVGLWGVLAPDTMILSLGTALGVGDNVFFPDRPNLLSSLYRATCSATGSVTHPPSAPVTPQVREEDGQLTLTWTAPANNGSAIQGYTVQWKESSYSEWFWEGIEVSLQDLPASTTMYTITGLTNATAYEVRVRASNAGGRGDWSDAASGTPSAVVDQTPRFGAGTYTATLTVGTPVNLTLPAATGGDGALRYTLSPLPAGLAFNSQTRVLSGTPTTAQAATAATYTVTDSDESEPDSATRSFTLTILPEDDQAPQFGPGAYAATLTVGTPVTLTLPAATGGDGALRYTLSPLPAGLAFNSQTRVLSGTPTTAQAATAATYTVTDSDESEPDSATRTFTLTIEETRTPGAFENPPDQSAQSGIGVLSGWVCEAETIEFELNGERHEAAYRTERLDTESVCGDTDNGFGMLYNWNRLGDGTHTVRVLVDGQEFDTATIRVTTLGEEFRRGLQGEAVLQDFPRAGQDSRLVWQEAQQNFVIATGSGGGTGSHRDTTQAVLENPAQGSYQSGIRILSGWVCEAEEVVLELDGVYQLTAGYRTERSDTESVCGDTDNGFGLLFNWSRLSDGPHTVRLLVDGEVYATATFAVTTLGEEFRRGLAGRYTVEDFPSPGESVTVEWQEAQQNFVIIAVE